jgi:predicted DCC family thiol-disulfide oxidoreductase YuxK
VTARPATEPGRPLLIFDGDCGFCTTSARAGQRWLGLEHVEPWQFLDLDTLPVIEAQCHEAVQWVAIDGTVSSAHEAVIASLRHAGGIWAVPGRLLAVPGLRSLAGVVYRTVARNRYRLPGGTPACRLPNT